MQPRQCDFCSDPAIRWRYPSEDYLVAIVSSSGEFRIMQNVGGWSACQECYLLIESDDWAALLRRSAQKLITASMPTEALQMLSRIHGEFFAHRSGRPIPVDPVTDQA